MTMDKDQTMADVKLENIMDSPMDGSFSNINKQQMQLRQQMIMSNHHAQAGQQFKQLPPVQISQLQVAQNNYNNMRTPTVKIEAIHKLLGGDSTIKHEPDQNKLMSPQK
ncbi:hypothetical protein J5N97_029562 [Dioscorea zingiberensis]|uniref:Uncharacterized protein n=1 Tax=Dioscorea zingiberensis TaxID=325984 RepID=A0A9D5H5Z6_9LILI|nr:hypothetical protein J5N97_029562 [Dioscorea zingiberensis]